jgi:1-deoxy-D-xylulose-5-phosphate reductoisomerase
LDLCRNALQRNAAATTALSAANEVAVDAFLESRIGFLDICTIVEEVMAVLERSDARPIAKSPSSFAEVIAVDQAARAAAQRIAANLAAA